MKIDGVENDVTSGSELANRRDVFTCRITTAQDDSIKLVAPVLQEIRHIRDVGTAHYFDSISSELISIRRDITEIIRNES